MTAGTFNDTSTFPDPVYKETVLRPLFDGAKDHHVEGFRLIDRAHLVMLHETGILTIEQARPIAHALEAIDRGLLLPDREAASRPPRAGPRRAPAYGPLPQ